eukprot:5588320-Alexandrium_andersonii.AAC.1
MMRTGTSKCAPCHLTVATPVPDARRSAPDVHHVADLVGALRLRAGAIPHRPSEALLANGLLELLD